jgi:hypothetical protein
MNVIIFGVGRSGTTAVYSILQEILTDNFNNAVDFVYEPFLREKEYFNGKYSDVAINAQYIDSFSFEGIYNHILLPLFIKNVDQFYPNDYLKNVLSSQNNIEVILAKFIRANGRFILLDKIIPECKFIFLIRNRLM